MNIFKIIKSLYNGEDNLYLHLSIFALCGTYSVAFANIAALFWNNSIYSSLFTVPSDTGTMVFSILGIVIYIYFIGYNFKFSCNLLNGENNLPSVSLNCFTVFAKIFPYLLFWMVFGIILLLSYDFLGLILIGKYHLVYYFWCMLPVLLIPFISIVLISFTKDLKYKKDFFSPVFLFKILKETFAPSILFTVQFALIYFVLTFGLKHCFEYLYYSNTKIMQMITILGLTIVTCYFQEVLYLAYFKGLTQIAKEKVFKQP